MAHLVPSTRSFKQSKSKLRTQYEPARFAGCLKHTGYDAEGNETSKVKIATGETYSYGYDQKNELIQVLHKATATATADMEVDYKYDPYGNRVEKDVLEPNGSGTGPYPGSVTLFALDGWNTAKASPIGLENWDVLFDLDGSNNLLTRYLRGDRVDELLARVGSDHTAYWELTDHLGSVRDVVTNSGTVADAIDYNAFGQIIAESAAGLRGRYGFTGRELEVEIGLQYNRARYYDASTGRWTSQDPMGFDAGDSNLYRYVNNKPSHQLDPSGLAPWYFDKYGIKWENNRLHDPPNGLRRVFEDLKDNPNSFSCEQLRDLQDLLRKSNKTRGASVGNNEAHVVRTFTEFMLYLALRAAFVNRPCGGNPPEMTYDEPATPPAPYTMPAYIADALRSVGVTVPRPVANKSPFSNLRDNRGIGLLDNGPAPSWRMPGVSPLLRDPYECIRCHPWDGRYDSPVPPPVHLTPSEMMFLGVTATVAVTVIVVATLPASAPIAGTVVVIAEVSSAAAAIMVTAGLGN